MNYNIIYIGILLNSYQVAHWLTMPCDCAKCHQAGPHCLVNTILDWIKSPYCLWAWLKGGISELLFTQRVTLRWLVIWVSWMCDSLDNFDRARSWIMQSCIADNINNNDRNNVSPIWRRILIYFRQIANRFRLWCNWRSRALAVGFHILLCHRIWSLPIENGPVSIIYGSTYCMCYRIWTPV